MDINKLILKFNYKKKSSRRAHRMKEEEEEEIRNASTLSRQTCKIDQDRKERREPGDGTGL